MKIVARVYPSNYYLWSAEHHARLAVEIEQQHSGPNMGSVRHWAYIINANGPDIHIRTLDQTIRERLTGYWISGEKSSILDKYNHTLELANRTKLDYGAEPGQSAAVLIALRNYFVHHKPENISTSLDPPKLATRLQGRFPDNALMAAAANPWFPDHAIGAGCARWAHMTARSFVDRWASLMELTSLPYQNPGWDEMP